MLKTLIDAVQNNPEWVTAVSTAALVCATIALWWTTKILADRTEKDVTAKKIQATVAAWEKVRAAIPKGFSPLNNQSKLTDDEKAALRALEYFSACMNYGAYDFGIFQATSRRWFMQQYRRISPYTESRGGKVFYAEIRTLHQKIAENYPAISDVDTDELS